MICGACGSSGVASAHDVTDSLSNNLTEKESQTMPLCVSCFTEKPSGVSCRLGTFICLDCAQLVRPRKEPVPLAPEVKEPILPNPWDMTWMNPAMGSAAAAATAAASPVSMTDEVNPPSDHLPHPPG